MDSTGNYKEQKRNTIKKSTYSIFKDFTERTTLHGIIKVFDAEISILRRLIWLLILLVCSVASALQTWELVSSYLSHETLSSVTLVNQESQKFPAVTICNFNLLRKDYMQKFEMDEKILREIMGNPSKHNTIRNNSKNVEFFNTPYDVLLKEGAHKMEEMLYACSFNQQFCSAKNFKPAMTEMGLCHKFEPSTMAPSHIIFNTGYEYGLTLTLTIQEEYYFSSFPGIAGLQIRVHDEDEPPLVTGNRIAVMPGAATFAAVTKKQVKSLPYPYKSKCQDLKLNDTSFYNKPLCYLQCKSSHYMKRCGCRTPSVPENAGVLVCTLLQSASCILVEDRTLHENISKSCFCPTPCNHLSYDVQLSYARYPSYRAKQIFLPSVLGNIENRSNNSNQNEEDALRRLERNSVQLNVFMQDLNYNIFQEIPKYDIEQILGAVGGLLGLCVGASIITVFEFIDCIFSLLLSKYFM